MRKYYEMPDLYTMDDYYRCFHQRDPGVYCMVRADIIPNEQSELWKYIQVRIVVLNIDWKVMSVFFQAFSASRPHFRHNELVYGVCVNSCKKLMEKVDGDLRTSYYNGELESNELVSILFLNFVVGHLFGCFW